MGDVKLSTHCQDSRANQSAECKKKSVLIGAALCATRAVNRADARGSCEAASTHLIMTAFSPLRRERQRHKPCHAVPENSSMPSKITVIVFQPMLVDKVSVMPPKKAGKKGAQMTPAFDAADADDHEDLQTIIAGDTG